MSCCNFDNRRYGPMREFNRYGGRSDNRRGCCNVNWGFCNINRLCPRRGSYMRGPRRPY